MYKHASRNLQRRVTRIESVRPAASAYIAEDDLIQTAENMSLDECEVERRNIILEKTRLENELLGAKNCGDSRAVTALGHRLQTIAQRLGLLNRRIKHFRHDLNAQAFRDAVKEVVPADILDRVYARQKEIIEAAEHDNT